jgi:rubrerythrin
MILLNPVKTDTIEELREAVQTAIMLEHSTIPPYLTANFTLQNTGNDEISNLIGSIVGEEMLHLSIACNLLNAIGGSPVLNQPGFIPTYPGPLPGGVESGLIVPIAKFSLELAENIFMQIEEPENRIHIELEALGGTTIGAFYNQIKATIAILEKEASEKGETIFTGKPEDQMTFEKFFPENLLFRITNEEQAIRGINIIIDQGEGTSKDPFVDPNDTSAGTLPEPAHFYRFEEIVKGKTLVADPKAKVGYSYSGAPIPFDNSKVPNMQENPKMSNYPVDSLAYVNSKLFNYNYTSLLNSLHRTFNGEPEQINAAMGLMFAIRLYALKLLAIPVPNNPDPISPTLVCGPSYEYVTNDDLSETERAQLV